MPLAIPALITIVAIPVIGMIARRSILQSFVLGLGMKPAAAVFGLIMETRKVRWIVVVSGLAVAAAGLIAFSEYLLGADFGAGRLFGTDHTPIVAGAVRLSGEVRGWYGRELGVALMVVSNIIALMAVLLWALTRLLEAERKVAEMNANLEATVNQRTEKLQRANRELEAFSYSVSHDLRAPLRAIDGYARCLEEDCGRLLDDDGRRFLAVVRSETRRMGELINDLLSFSQIGRKLLIPVRLDLGALSQEIAEELQRSHPDRVVELRISNLPVATGDRATISQVLANLLSNAVKYSGKTTEGSIVVEISGKTDAGENVYTIRDHGVGFDMRYVSKLFGVFQRLHSAEEFEGTGVGLAIVERIIARHGGRVWAEGRVGEGATFSFSLPVVAGNDVETATESAA